MRYPAATLLLAFASATVGVAATADEPRDASRVEFGGDAAVRWLRHFGTEHDDWINELVRSRDGEFLAAGYVNRGRETPGDWRALLVKLDGAGTVRWSREHGEGGGIDAYWAVRETAQGFTLAGFTDRIGSGGLDAAITQLDASGEFVREYAFGGARPDRSTDLALTKDGGALLVGQTESFGAGERDVLLVRTLPDGREQWRRAYGSADIDRGLYVEPSGDGFVISGAIGREGDVDLLVFKVDADGRELWRRVIGAAGSNDINHGLATRPDGRILVTGYTQSFGSRVHDMMAVTLAPDGRVLRHEVMGGADDDRVMTAGFDAGGRAWLVGYTRSAGAGGWDAFLVALDRNGAFEPGIATFGTAAEDYGTTVLALPDGDLLVGGYSESLGRGGQDAFVMRIGPPQRRSADDFLHRRVD